ncbi:hypothetical protein KYB31_22455 [Clostridium felsineum]|uniref:hypothetical protein n=1 Tax=Clostridium felsineum TaxID=36839 RepID=UPI00214DE300|nr:hypothetical protein [Clostridium felsineum]MCR3761738.1 hypothetical protein [Clostridium felsineum]
MIKIQNNYTNSNNTNTVVDDLNKINTKTNNSSNTAKDTKVEESKGDTINISNTNQNLTTAQKAKKAIDDTLNEFKNADCGKYYDMTGPMVDMMDLMVSQGIHPVPNDILSNLNSNENAGSFIDFADNLKALAEKNLDKVPPSFINFCDKLKQNLIINGL